jgi:hypothetical protein
LLTFIQKQDRHDRLRRQDKMNKINDKKDVTIKTITKL